MPVCEVDAKALLTRSPLIILHIAMENNPFDLHALSTPPAFILDQDQILILNRKISGHFVRLSPFGLRRTMSEQPEGLNFSIEGTGCCH